MTAGWREHDELVQPVLGVERVMSLTRLASLPKLDRPSRKQIAVLVGVAPLAHDSGKRRGPCRAGQVGDIAAVAAMDAPGHHRRTVKGAGHHGSK